MQALSPDLVPLYSVEKSAGTGFHFPCYNEKDIHCSNYPLPLCSSIKHNRCHCRWNYSDGGENDDKGKNLIADTRLHSHTLFNILKEKKKKKDVGCPRRAEKWE